jgi:hypothetical protein
MNKRERHLKTLKAVLTNKHHRWKEKRLWCLRDTKTWKHNKMSSLKITNQKSKSWESQMINLTWLYPVINKLFKKNFKFGGMSITWLKETTLTYKTNWIERKHCGMANSNSLNSRETLLKETLRMLSVSSSQQWSNCRNRKVKARASQKLLIT